MREQEDARARVRVHYPVILSIIFLSLSLACGNADVKIADQRFLLNAVIKRPTLHGRSR